MFKNKANKVNHSGLLNYKDASTLKILIKKDIKENEKLIDYHTNHNKDYGERSKLIQEVIDSRKLLLSKLEKM